MPDFTNAEPWPSLPLEAWSETYATADVIAYDGKYRVKIGREFLFPPNVPREA